MESTYIGNERRSSKRIRVNCTVIYRVNEDTSAHFLMQGKDIEDKMIYVSQGGYGDVTNYDIPVSTVLSMRFALLNVDKDVVRFTGSMDVTGEVRSNMPFEVNDHRVGKYKTQIRYLFY